MTINDGNQGISYIINLSTIFHNFKCENNLINSVVIFLSSKISKKTLSRYDL